MVKNYNTKNCSQHLHLDQEIIRQLNQNNLSATGKQGRGNRKPFEKKNKILAQTHTQQPVSVCRQESNNHLLKHPKCYSSETLRIATTFQPLASVVLPFTFVPLIYLDYGCDGTVLARPAWHSGVAGIINSQMRR